MHFDTHYSDSCHSDWIRCVCCLIRGINLLGQFYLHYKAAVWSVSSLPTNKLLIQPKKKHTIYHDNQINLLLFHSCFLTVVRLCAYWVRDYLMLCDYNMIIFIQPVRWNSGTVVCMILRKKLWVTCLVWGSQRKCWKEAVRLWFIRSLMFVQPAHS